MAMQQSLQSTDRKIDALNICKDAMAAKLDKHATCLTMAEQRISSAEDEEQALTRK